MSFYQQVDCAQDGLVCVAVGFCGCCALVRSVDARRYSSACFGHSETVADRDGAEFSTAVLLLESSAAIGLHIH